MQAAISRLLPFYVICLWIAGHFHQQRYEVVFSFAVKMSFIYIFYIKLP